MVSGHLGFGCMPVVISASQNVEQIFVKGLELNIHRLYRFIQAWSLTSGYVPLSKLSHHVMEGLWRGGIYA